MERRIGSHRWHRSAGPGLHARRWIRCAAAAPSYRAERRQFRRFAVQHLCCGAAGESRRASTRHSRRVAVQHICRRAVGESRRAGTQHSRRVAVQHICRRTASGGPHTINLNPMKTKTLISTFVGVSIAALNPLAHGQGFNSGSTGIDGVLNVTVDMTLNLPPDGILNYTTIHVNTGTTLRFNANQLNTPVYLLALGDVTIDGIINVSAGDAT